MHPTDWISWLLKLIPIRHSPSSEDVSIRLNTLHGRLLLVGLVMLTLGYSPIAQAEIAQAEIVGDRANELLVAADAGNLDRLAIPADAAEIPEGSVSEQVWTDLPPPAQPAAALPVDPSPVDISPADTSKASLAAAAENPPVAIALLQTVKAATEADESISAKTARIEPTAKPVELAFGLPPSDSALPQTVMPKVDADVPASPVNPVDPALPITDLATLFVGNSDSLVAKAVGSAEGTRTPEGDRNPAYFGHVDPGNKAWNLGSFSYQHEATTPEDADVKQLNRLQDQASIMQAKAQAKGLSLTVEEALNGIDLANQAPKAALDQDGYIDWLAKAHQNGLSGDNAVLWARTQSFFDPHLQRWNAPGLGNTQESINHDQERRMQAIDRAIAVHKPPQNQPVVQPAAQPAAQASLNKISEDVGIARLFAEQTITRFGGSAPAPKSSFEPTRPISASQPAAEFAASAPQKQTAAPDPAAASLPESPGIAALFELDLPAS